MKLFLVILFAVLIAGCATTHHAATYTEIQDVRAAGIYHTVKAGETLWKISELYGLDAATLAKANSLSDRSLLEKGQVLVIPRRAEQKRARTANYSPKSTFVWPVKGDVISPFGTKIDRTKNKGIDIRADEGIYVRASRAGMVAFCDERLKGFGKTVILDHGDNYQTVYAYNSAILVRIGDTIEQNAVIARVGRTGRAKEPSLHFEIRKNGEPRNPFDYLAR